MKHLPSNLFRTVLMKCLASRWSIALLQICGCNVLNESAIRKVILRGVLAPGIFRRGYSRGYTWRGTCSAASQWIGIYVRPSECHREIWSIRSNLHNYVSSRHVDSRLGFAAVSCFCPVYLHV